MWKTYSNSLRQGFLFENALDLGCSWGGFSEDLTQKWIFNRLVGVDYNQETLDVFQKNFSSKPNLSVETLCKGVGDDDFCRFVPKESLDLIYSRALFWVCSKETTRKTFENIVKTIKPTGTVLLVNSFIKKRYLEGPQTAFKNAKDRAWAFDELKEMIISTGLADKCKNVNFYCSDSRCYEIIAGNFDCFTELPYPVYRLKPFNGFIEPRSVYPTHRL